MKRTSVISSMALATALMTQAAPAFAQQAAAPAAEETVDANDIVVTANKREERLQEVAVSVQAVDAETLDNFAIESPKEFSQISPTLNFQAADEARLFNFSIRGIGTESFSVAVEPSVSTIVDGVVYTRVGSVFDGISDLERVEVLNGPQGTLQGKNASAGAVVIVTKAPNRDEFEGKAELGIAEHGEYSGKLSLTGPINDRMAYRVSAHYMTEDGIVKDIRTGKTVNNVESYGVRGKLLWEPADGAVFTLAADWSKRNADCCAEPIRIAPATGNVTAAFTGTPVGPNNTFVALDTEQVGYQKNLGVSLTADIDVADHTLTSITAYRQYRDFAIRDRDGTPAPFSGVTPTQLFGATNPGVTVANAQTLMDNLLLNPLSFACRQTSRSSTELVCGESQSLELNNTFSQELRVASPTGGAVDYVFGLFYYNAFVERDLTIAGVRSNIAGNVTYTNPTTIGAIDPDAYVLADMISKVRTENYAVFANVNYYPFENFTLTGGVRFVYDTIDWRHQKVTGPNGDHIGPATSGGANAGTPNFNVRRKFNDSAVLGRITAKYQFTPDLMVYTSWAHGYKAQAVDADIFVSLNGFNASPVAPETSDSWEVGFKSQWLDRRLTVNVTAYDTKFKGYQTTSAGTTGSDAPVLRSAGSLKTKGIEGEVIIRPVDGLRLSGNFLFADNKFGDLFVTPTLNIAGGNPLNAPETKWGVSASYDMPMGEWNVNVSTNYTYTSETLFTNLADANNPNSVWIRPSFGVANGAITFSAPNDQYKLTLYAKNLFDEQYVAGLRRISGSVGGGGAVAQALPRDFERYFGATFAIKF